MTWRKHIRPREGKHRTLARSEAGAVIVEFALVAPLMLLMMMGILAYGGWFWRAHALQQVANDSARAALGGLTATERDGLARTAAAQELATLADLPANRTTVAVTQTSDLVSISIVYDGSADAFLSLPLVPLPGRSIRRTAAVRLGGY